MFGKHFSSLTSAYYHDQLSTFHSRRVAEHLIGCRSCRDIFEEVKFGARLAAHLPVIEAPDSLWRGIENALDVDCAPALIRKRGRPPSIFFQPRFAFTSLALIVLVAGFAAFFMLRRPGQIAVRQPDANSSTCSVRRPS